MTHRQIDATYYFSDFLKIRQFFNAPQFYKNLSDNQQFFSFFRFFREILNFLKLDFFTFFKKTFQFFVSFIWFGPKNSKHTSIEMTQSKKNVLLKSKLSP